MFNLSFHKKKGSKPLQIKTLQISVESRTGAEVID